MTNTAYCHTCKANKNLKDPIIVNIKRLIGYCGIGHKITKLLSWDKPKNARKKYEPQIVDGQKVKRKCVKNEGKKRKPYTRKELGKGDLSNLFGHL